MSEHAFLSVICRDDANKGAVLRIGTLTGGTLCRESHPLCRLKNPTVVYMITCRLSSCKTGMYNVRLLIILERGCSSMYRKEDKEPFYYQAHKGQTRWLSTQSTVRYFEYFNSVFQDAVQKKAFGIRNSERFCLVKQKCVGLNGTQFRVREFVRFSERFGIQRVRFSGVGLYLNKEMEFLVCFCF